MARFSRALWRRPVPPVKRGEGAVKKSRPQGVFDIVADGGYLCGFASGA